VADSYEFLVYINNFKLAHDRFKLIIWALNAAIITLTLYAIFLLIGLPAFMKFYWHGFLALEYLPLIVSIVAGVLLSTIINNKQKENVLNLLGPELSEKTKTAYDNSELKSILMDSLAHDVALALSKIDPSTILNWKKIEVRIISVVSLVLATVVIIQGQISADITPADFQSLSNLRDQALGIFRNDMQTQGKEFNLSGNIYGKPSLAVLGEEKIELMLYPGLAAGSRARSTEPVNRYFQQSGGNEVSIVPAELYIESMPAQNREIIKRYFELLATG
jgi:hypothetical protein